MGLRVWFPLLFIALCKAFDGIDRCIVSKILDVVKHVAPDERNQKRDKDGLLPSKRNTVCVLEIKRIEKNLQKIDSNASSESMYFMNILRSVRGNVGGETKLTTRHESSALRGKSSTHAPFLSGKLPRPFLLCSLSQINHFYGTARAETPLL